MADIPKKLNYDKYKVIRVHTQLDTGTCLPTWLVFMCSWPLIKWCNAACHSLCESHDIFMGICAGYNLLSLGFPLLCLLFCLRWSIPCTMPFMFLALIWQCIQALISLILQVICTSTSQVQVSSTNSSSTVRTNFDAICTLGEEQGLSSFITSFGFMCSLASSWLLTMWSEEWP